MILKMKLQTHKPDDKLHMIRKGDILYNPFNRETITFIQTAEDTYGQNLHLDIIISGVGKHLNSYMHVHPMQMENLKIKSGEVWITINKEKMLLKEGDLFSIPAGIPHMLENACAIKDLNFTCELVPALHSECIFETVMALCQASLISFENGMPLLQSAAILNKYKDHIYWTGNPLWFQKLAFKALYPLALLMGYKSELEYNKVVNKNTITWHI